MKFIDTYNAIAGGVVVILSAIFGEYWYLFAAFLVMNVIDFITGTYKSRVLKTECSNAGWRGVAKKALYWLIILMGFLIASVLSHIGEGLLDTNLNFMYLLGYFILATLFINECRSVCENLVQAGIKVPALLTAGLAVAQKTIDGVVPESIKDAMQHHLESETDSPSNKN
jgi:toxin secretion/phage lysis holin